MEFAALQTQGAQETPSLLQARILQIGRGGAGGGEEDVKNGLGLLEKGLLLRVLHKIGGRIDSNGFRCMMVPVCEGTLREE